ncbi:hypothetical protein OF83DRAFT_1085702 [Amylostereum chailletii]|nr:hypothetical protein OF83DRAFT_1085702 [Amylostereum chailletii]
MPSPPPSLPFPPARSFVVHLGSIVTPKPSQPTVPTPSQASQSSPTPRPIPEEPLNLTSLDDLRFMPEVVFDAMNVPFKATDCLVIDDAPHSDGRFYISSPNAHWIPEMPWHEAGQVFSYFSDGMLGAFEYTKWPQVWDATEPHLVLAPLNPKIRNIIHEDVSRHRLWPTPMPSPCFRPPITDATPLITWDERDIVWLDFNPGWWEMAFHTEQGTLGRVDPSVAKLLRVAVADCSDRCLQMAADIYPVSTHPGRRYAAQQVVRLSWAIDNLVDSVLTLVDALQWFREAQHLIMDLRAWADYHAVLKPAWEQSLSHGSSLPCYPLHTRGAITSQIAIVERLYALGVPVWWVRPRHTLTKSTKFSSDVRERVWKVADVFSTSRTAVIANITVSAPSWMDSINLDTTIASINDQLRKFTHTNRPSVTASRPVIDELPTTPLSPSTASPPSLAPLPNRLEWAPKYDKVWEKAWRLLPPLKSPKVVHAPIYALPPVAMFTGQSTQVSTSVHNGLRVREWVLFTHFHGEEQAVEMTAQQWKIACEGKYIQIQFAKDARVLPKSSTQDILRLPVGTPSAEGNSDVMLGKRGPSTRPQTAQAEPPAKASKSTAGQRKVNKRRDIRLADRADINASKSTAGQRKVNKRRDIRLADRADINVRFGVRGGFSPITSDCKVCWRGWELDFKVLEGDRSLWAEVLLRLDLQVVPDLNGSPAAIRARQDAIQRVWGAGGDVLVKFVDGVHPKDLAITEDGFNQWAAIMVFLAPPTPRTLIMYYLTSSFPVVMFSLVLFILVRSVAPSLRPFFFVFVRMVV